MIKTVLIGGGGTGGHIYPAVAVAQAFKKINPEIQVYFVGTRGGLETKIVPKEGFPLHFIDIGALNNVGLTRKILTIILLPFSLLQSMRLILRFKPQVILGLGGYSSGPVMLAAKLLDVFFHMRLYLFEPNAYPGLTNRWLSRIVAKAFVNFDATRKYFEQAEVVGIPIREGLRATARKPSERLRVLIFGGSQGARGINNTVIAALKVGGLWLEQIEIVHQTGNRDFSAVDQEYQSLNLSHARCFEYLYDMPDRYAWADIVVCRAGASTLAELSACHKAAIVVPFPDAADNHQQKNAEALATRGAAIMVVQSEFTPQKFISLMEDFIHNRDKITRLENEIEKFYKPQSAEKIVQALVGKNL